MIDKTMRFPRNEAYAVGWQWAGDSLTCMAADEVEDSAQGAAWDLGEAVGDPEMVHEGILDRLAAEKKSKK